MEENSTYNYRAIINLFRWVIHRLFRLREHIFRRNQQIYIYIYIYKLDETTLLIEIAVIEVVITVR